MNTANNSTSYKIDLSKSNIPKDYEYVYTLCFIKKNILPEIQGKNFIGDLAKLLNKSERVVEYSYYKKKNESSTRDFKGYEIRVIADWLGLAISDLFTDG